MRVTIVKQPTNLAGVAAQLLKAGKNTAAILARITALNPHVDIKRIEAGTVLLLPDLPEVLADAGDTIGAGTLDDFEKEIGSGFKDTIERLRAGVERRKAERDDVDRVVKTAVTKRVLASDAALRQQVADAEKLFKAEQKEAQQTAKTVETMRDLAEQELKALRQLFG
jgi:hypothetical protein